MYSPITNPLKKINMLVQSLISGVITHYTAIEDPIDECKEGTHTCHHHADCVDIQNGFLCECREGYQGDGFECIGITLK